MNIILTSLFATCGIATSVFAGTPMISTSKEYKTTEANETCFGEHEWQIDLFGQYSVGEGPNQVQLFRDHGWGGGVGINYFFTRNWGLGVDAAWLYGKEGPGLDDGDHHGSHRTVTHNFTGSLIFRVPIDDSCLAPYLYAGGGLSVDGEQWATAHAGVGVEYRITPQKFGVFLDGRWTYLGDRFGHEDLNFFSSRVGFRFIF